MDGLRWLLLFFGVIVIVGVYLYSRRERDESPIDELDKPRVAPTFGDEQLEGEESGESAEHAPPLVADDAAIEPDDAGDAGPSPQKIVTLRLIAKGKSAFRGDDLILSLRGIGMRHGKFGIFHQYDGNDDSRTVFSAASLVEPGSFDLANIKDQEIPGISLFLVLPGPIDSVDAFDRMLTAARAIAQTLDAELLDESGSTLSIQRERYMREEVIEFQHSNMVA